jgi:CheY-like chemotaxis protein
MAKKKILVVDDERDVRTVVKEILEKAAYAVTAVENGAKALALLEKQRFDLVLLDILMPDLSGDEVACKIRKNSRTKNQKIAFLTVLASADYKKNIVKKTGAVDYIRKPIESAVLRDRVKQILSA